MDSKADARAKEKAERDPEEDAFSRRGKADQTSPTTPPTPGKQKDHGTTIPGKSHLGMTGPRTMPKSPVQQSAEERKAKRAKEKASTERMEKMAKEALRME